ncbi:MAG: divalent metal cation transporter [Myxococcota bacterium]
MRVNHEQRDPSELAALGPGLLFAAAAVGVSHLVQSTRAGARYGLGLVGVVVLANLVKYPAFRFGPHYAALTGRSLLDGYREVGRWALVLYGLLTLGTMFTVQAAVTVVTAGLLIAVTGIGLGPVEVSAGLLLGGGVVLYQGRFRLLDRITKVLVAVLTVATLVSSLLALPRVPWSTLSPFSVPRSDATLFFVVALFGWMPSAIDVSVWQSLWTLARGRERGGRASLRAVTLDFHIGYIGTAVLALCFVVMGAGVVYGSAGTIPDSAAGFAALVIQLYTSSLGFWVEPIVGLSALAVMISTTLTVLDGFPRAVAAFVEQWSSSSESPEPGRPYWIAMVVLGGGAMVVLAKLLQSLRAMIDVATTLSFLTAPLLSWLNHRAVLTATQMHDDEPPSPWLLRSSVVSIAFQAAFAAFFLYLRFFR